MVETRKIWDIATVAGGVLILSLTLYHYRLIDPTGVLGRTVLSASQTDGQIKAAESQIANDPNDFHAWTALALGYYYKGPGFYDKAMNALYKARSLGANSEKLFYYAGVMFESLGLPDYATDELSKYLRHYPDDHETQARLGNLYFRQKQYDEALAIYRSIVGRWSKDPVLWVNYALVNKEKNNLAEALSALEHAREIMKTLPEGGYYQMGEIYRLQGNEGKAAECYRQELVSHPSYLPSLEALDVYCRRQGDMKQSREWRKKISELKKSTVVK